MDRGGLWHIKSTTYQLFYAIECQIRVALSVLLKPSPPSKAEMIKTIASNENVQFHRLIAMAEFEIDDKETHEVLLAKIVQELLTIIIRSFSKAGAWMEKFKQTTKSLHNVLEVYEVNCVVIVLMNSIIVIVFVGALKYCKNCVC